MVLLALPSPSHPLQAALAGRDRTARTSGSQQIERSHHHAAPTRHATRPHVAATIGGWAARPSRGLPCLRQPPFHHRPHRSHPDPAAQRRCESRCFSILGLFAELRARGQGWWSQVVGGGEGRELVNVLWAEAKRRPRILPCVHSAHDSPPTRTHTQKALVSISLLCSQRAVSGARVLPLVVVDAQLQ
jgi:hypothetical protein